MAKKDTEFQDSAQDRDDLARVYHAIMARNPEHDFEPTLDRVTQVLDLLGNPQHAFRSVHITGTNGKTSTARMVESLVAEHGLRTGRFTSPHLASVTERITIDGEPVSARRFVEVYEDVIHYIEMVDASSQAVGGPALSFFEVLVVMAYAAFADAPVDVAVVEVGMGGVWDATNVITPQVSIITPISLDHTQWLGDTYADIAAEKAGIIKEGRPVIVSAQPPSAHDVIVHRAHEVGAQVIADGVDMGVASRLPAVGGQLVSLRTPAATYTDVFLPLFGSYQADNAVAALVATEVVMAGGGALHGDIVEAGFAKVTSPGRLEVVRSSPTIVLDAAHNPGGIEALTQALDESFDFTRLVGVVSCLADKDAETLFALLEPHLAEVVVTSIDSPRAADIEDLADIARDIFGEDRVAVEPVLDAAIDAAATRAESQDTVGSGIGTGVLIVGSVLLVAHARSLLLRERRR